MCISADSWPSQQSVFSVCPASRFSGFAFFSLVHFSSHFPSRIYPFSSFHLTFSANLDIPAIFCSVFSSVESLTAGIILHCQQPTVLSPSLFLFSPLPSSLHSSSIINKGEIPLLCWYVYYLCRCPTPTSTSHPSRHRCDRPPVIVTRAERQPLSLSLSLFASVLDSIKNNIIINHPLQTWSQIKKKTMVLFG